MQEGESPLICAVKRGSMQMVEFLLWSGASLICLDNVSVWVYCTQRVTYIGTHQVKRTHRKTPKLCFETMGFQIYSTRCLYPHMWQAFWCVSSTMSAWNQDIWDADKGGKSILVRFALDLRGENAEDKCVCFGACLLRMDAMYMHEAWFVKYVKTILVLTVEVWLIDMPHIQQICNVRPWILVWWPVPWMHTQ